MQGDTAGWCGLMDSNERSRVWTMRRHFFGSAAHAHSFRPLDRIAGADSGVYK